MPCGWLHSLEPGDPPVSKRLRLSIQAKEMVSGQMEEEVATLHGWWGHFEVSMSVWMMTRQKRLSTSRR
jgi:hypothetical protein